ncbi:ANKRA2 family protein [Megaselia abdita]
MSTTHGEGKQPTTPDFCKTQRNPKTTVLTNFQRGNTEKQFCDEINLTFHECAGQGELSVDQLKSTVLNPDLNDKYSFTPLHWACYYGQLSSAEILIATNRVDVNSLAPDLVTPLHLAAAGGHHEIVRLLLQKNANPDALDIVGNTPLMYASALNHPHTCNELLLKSFDITTENEHGDTAYSLAVENNATLSQAILEQYLFAVLSLEKSGKFSILYYYALLVSMVGLWGFYVVLERYF